jgi:hypothetical protein
MTEDEAYERLESHGTLQLSYEDGIECEEELRSIGVDINLVEGCLHQIDYLSCSIKYDSEYHLGGALEEEYEKLREHLNNFYLDYEIN